MDKVYQDLLERLNIKYGDCIIVGVSGGPDSMALLHILIRLKKALDLQIIVAHVNHNTGRKGQFEEQKFVEEYAKKNSLVFETMTIKEYGDDNFHNEARSIRYNYFNSLVKKYHAKYVFTAHHADDLIETILMSIVRGSTLKGYSGFSKTVKMSNYYIIRPLIQVTKDEIYNYLNKNKIKYMQDSSNTKDVYTRNRFRKYIVPEFNKEDKMDNEMMLGLRLLKGINKEAFEQKYHVKMESVYPIKPLLKNKDLVLKDGYIFIPEDKIYIMNEILLKMI